MKRTTALLISIVLVFCIAFCTSCSDKKEKSKKTSSQNTENKTVTVSVYGDSISTLKGYNPLNYNVRYVQFKSQATGNYIYMPYEKTWWGSLITEMGWTLGVNDSWAGSRVSNESARNEGNVGPDIAMVSMTRISHLGEKGDPDYILFFGGTNDIGRNVRLGEFDPELEFNDDGAIFSDFATAYAMTLLRLKHTYPNAEIIAITPGHTKTYYSDTALQKYNGVIKQICDNYKITCVDLSVIDPTEDIFADEIHPNELGMQRIKDLVKAAIEDK